MISLDEAVESAKISAGRERILRQQHFEDLLNQLPDEERYPFTMALVELGINTRRGSQSRSIDAFLGREGHNALYLDQELEDKIVRASMSREAGWWDDLKQTIKDWTGWGDEAAEDYLEEEYDMSEPVPEFEPLTERVYPPPGMPTEEDVQQHLMETVPEPDETDYNVFEGFRPPGEVEMPVMHAVESSNIEAIGYDETEGLLYVAFSAKRNTPRTLYQYFNVSPDEFGQFLGAESKGKWFHQNIREEKPYTKMDIGLLG